jgi:hypothetical protein
MVAQLVAKDAQLHAVQRREPGVELQKMNHRVGLPTDGHEIHEI